MLDFAVVRGAYCLAVLLVFAVGVAFVAVDCVAEAELLVAEISEAVEH